MPIGTGTRRSIWQEAAEGVRFVLAHPYLRLTLPAGMVNNLCVSALQAVLVLYMTDGLGLPPAVIGLLFTAVGVGALVGSLGVLLFVALGAAMLDGLAAASGR